MASFGYFSVKENDFLVLKEVNRILENDGVFVLDFLNAELVKKKLTPSENNLINGKSIAIKRWIDESTNRVEKQIIIHESDGIKRYFNESVHLYTNDMLQQMFVDAGFNVKETFGDYHGAPFDEHSPRLILIGTKHA